MSIGSALNRHGRSRGRQETATPPEPALELTLESGAETAPVTDGAPVTADGGDLAGNADGPGTAEARAQARIDVRFEDRIAAQAAARASAVAQPLTGADASADAEAAARASAVAAAQAALPALVVPPMPDHLPVPVRQVYTPLITNAPGLNWVGPGDAWTRAWAQPPAPPAPPVPPVSQAQQAEARPPGVPQAGGRTGAVPVGSGAAQPVAPSTGSPFPPLPPLLTAETAVAVIPLAARAKSTEPDKVLVQRVLAAVEPVADRAVAHFYAVLFVRSPELRALFPAAMDLQRDRLFRALLAAARVADDPAALRALIEPLARGHRKYGVRNEHYAPVGSALLAALARFGGSAWNRHTEAAMGRVYGVVSQLMIDAAEQDAMGSPPWWQAEVVSVEALTGEIAQVTVRTDHPYPFRAGQYATLEVPLWPRVWRPYSLANAPRPDGLLTFQVKAVPAGWVSNALVRRTTPGDVLRLGPPAGTMVLRPGSRAPLLMVGGGTGISPILALVQEMASLPTAQRRSVEVFYGARSESELYALAGLNDLAKRHSWLAVRTAVLEGPTRGLRGALPDVVAGQGPWDEYEAYVSGPPAMVRRGVRALYAVGVAEDRIQHDLGDETLT